MTLDLPAAINFVVWLAVAFILFPGFVRRLKGRPRYLDDIWTIALFIVVAREAQAVSPYVEGDWLFIWSQYTAAAVGVAYFVVARGYMRDDSERG